MQTKDSFKVEVSKDFEVPVEKLYEAWTQPEHLKQWWKPMNDRLSEVTNELKEGGTVKYVFEDQLTISGKYDEVKPNERLVYSWNWHFPQDAVKNAEYLLTVEFKNSGSGSSIKVTQNNFKDEEGTLPHQEGWKKGLEDLKQFLSSNSNSSSSSNNNNSGNSSSTNPETDRSGGYNESPEQAKVGGG